jgi:hypothetical protein
VTPNELSRVAERLMDTWPNSNLRDAKLMAPYTDLLAELPFEPVMVTVEEFRRENREFAPKAGSIYQRTLERLVNAPQWEEAYAQLRRLHYSMASPYYEWTDASGRSRQKEVVERIMADWPRVLRNFVEDCGRSQLVENLGNEEHGEARLRTKYNAYVSKAIQQVATANIQVEGADELPHVREARRQAPRHLGDVLERVVGELGPGA